MVRMFMTWQMNRKIARWEKIRIMLGHGVRMTEFRKLVDERNRLEEEIINIERKLGL